MKEFGDLYWFVYIVRLSNSMDFIPIPRFEVESDDCLLFTTKFNIPLSRIPEVPRNVPDSVAASYQKWIYDDAQSDYSERSMSLILASPRPYLQLPTRVWGTSGVTATAWLIQIRIYGYLMPAPGAGNHYHSSSHALYSLRIWHYNLVARGYSDQSHQF
jgi:hypothetical protein